MGAIWCSAYASVAQLVEQVTLNHRVLGSSPSRGNILDVNGRLSLKGRRAFYGEGEEQPRLGSGRVLGSSPSRGNILDKKDGLFLKGMGEFYGEGEEQPRLGSGRVLGWSPSRGNIL